MLEITPNNTTLSSLEITERLEKHKLFVADKGDEMADFSGCNLSGFRFINVPLKHVSFNKCKITNCEFVECDLYKSDFSLAYGHDVTFINCSASLANFSQCQLVSCSIQDCDFTGSAFCDSELLSSNIAYCNLSETNFMNAILTNTKLHKVDMFHMVGNNNNIFSVQLGGSTCIYSSEYIQIDEMKATIPEWRSFYMNNYDTSQFKKLTEIIPILFLIMTSYPAKPTLP